MNYKFETIGSSYRLDLPHRGQPWLIAFRALNTLVVGIGLLGCVYWAIYGDKPFGYVAWIDRLFALLAMWVWVLIVGELLWQVAGQETIEFSNDAVSIQHRVFGIGL